MRGRKKELIKIEEWINWRKCDIKPHFYVRLFTFMTPAVPILAGVRTCTLASDSRRHSTHRLSDEFHFCSRKTNETVPGDTCDTSTTPLLESLSWTKRAWNCEILLQIDPGKQDYFPFYLIH